ncbi:RHS repeat-associated core domain-containing protein [Streptomyces sp. NPDC058964]|uniref:RHS repeat-associated core domain-containing protein n=1 Tax=Streptomyces sp. NPDC058964 TaxID=3346681 RepID=UPI0036C3FA4D
MRTKPSSWVAPDENHGFLGQPADPVTGLDLLGARNYDPVVGRFLTPDPVFQAGDPDRMGGCAYAADNPASSSDPTGYDDWYNDPSMNKCAIGCGGSKKSGSGGGTGTSSGSAGGGGGSVTPAAPGNPTTLPTSPPRSAPARRYGPVRRMRRRLSRVPSRRGAGDEAPGAGLTRPTQKPLLAARPRPQRQRSSSIPGCPGARGLRSVSAGARNLRKRMAQRTLFPNGDGVPAHSAKQSVATARST